MHMPPHYDMDMPRIFHENKMSPPRAPLEAASSAHTRATSKLRVPLLAFAKDLDHCGAEAADSFAGPTRFLYVRE